MLSKEELGKYCDIDGAIEILGRLLGWSPERVIEWAQQFEDQLENPWFDYEGFFRYICKALIPPETFQRLTPDELQSLQNSLHEPLIPRFWLGDKPDDRGWKIVRLQIDTCIGLYDKEYLKNKKVISLKDLEP
ncbi:hypothetical protein [Gimesia fumaroli]|uniref:Uncharacterized protein n=1 Tax=Gimesia fumaroli TaxID=2527976 RepID=A0A518IAF5_9PLAN|nr:hypothetical protein [Gimesia fumaroli]QDV50098.1 hypothetical protein Enr17x_21340 [Gimesia fumaroli]